MFDVADRVITEPAFPDTTVLTERLARFASEMEALGLPWAAAHIRNVSDMVGAERGLSNAFRH